jgi:dTDP-glucose 4,6-dehydratase
LDILLVTGGCGFIGSHFVRLVLRERPQCRVINFDLLTYAGNLENLSKDKETRNPARYHFIQGDIADSIAIKRLFQEESIDTVVNFAAETHVDRSLLDSAPFLRTNVEGLRVLLEAAWNAKAKRFLQVSSDEVYGTLAPAESAFTEDNPLKPNSPYAASKAAGDLLVRAYHRSYGVPALITRCGNNYGPYQFPEKFLPLVITNALEDRPLPLYGDGKQIRDWIHVEDHARALLLVVEQGKAGEVYNIGASGEQTNLHMAEWVLQITGKPNTLIRYVKDRPGHDRRYSIDATKVCTELNWLPTITLEAGIRETVDWFSRERNWWQRIKSGEYRRYYDKQYGDQSASKK